MYLPACAPPSVQMFHFDKVDCTSETNASSVVLTYHADRQPALRSEEQLPPSHFFRPTLFVSFGDWQKRAPAAAPLMRSPTQTRPRESTPRLWSKASTTRRLAFSPFATTCCAPIRPAGPSYLDLPLDCLSSPDRTLADQYGNPADRAILLTAMLDAAGFDAKILFASSDTTEFPAFSEAAARSFRSSGSTAIRWWPCVIKGSPFI